MSEEQQEVNNSGKKEIDMQKVIIGLLLLIILLGCAGAGYFIFFASKDSGDSEKTADIFTLKLDTFTVNLADNDYRRYLRTDITLEMYTEEAQEEISVKIPRIRDKIITILTQKSVKDFDTGQKIEKTRLELVKAVNGILSEQNQIKALYFENFIIQ